MSTQPGRHCFQATSEQPIHRAADRSTISLWFWPGHCDNGRFDGVPLVVETSITLTSTQPIETIALGYNQRTCSHLFNLQFLVMVRLAKHGKRHTRQSCARENDAQVPAVTESSSFAICTDHARHNPGQNNVSGIKVPMPTTLYAKLSSR